MDICSGVAMNMEIEPFGDAINIVKSGKFLKAFHFGIDNTFQKFLKSSFSTSNLNV